MFDPTTFDPNNLQGFTIAKGAVEAALAESRDVAAVTDEATADAAADKLAVIVRARNTAEEQRKHHTKPLNDQKRAIDGAFKELTGPLDGAEKALKDQVAAFHREQQRIAAEAARAAEEERRREERNAQERQRRANLRARQEGTQPVQHQPAQVAAPPPKPAPTRQTQSGAQVQAKAVWRFSIEDEAQVPREYLMVDERKVRQAVNGGARQIAGIRIWEDVNVAVRG